MAAQEQMTEGVAVTDPPPRKLRQQSAFKNVVLVAITGYGQESDRQLSQEAGFDHHLVKPADFGKVTQILASVSKNAK